jgi:hypothetical protein
VGVQASERSGMSAEEAPPSEFVDGFRGDLLNPVDEGYEEARKLYNAMIDRRPALIARCADVADVIAAVNRARERASESPSGVAGTTGQDWEAATRAA